MAFHLFFKFVNLSVNINMTFSKCKSLPIIQVHDSKGNYTMFATVSGWVIHNVLQIWMKYRSKKSSIFCTLIFCFFFRWSQWYCPCSSQLHFFKKLSYCWWQLWLSGIKHSCFGIDGFVCSSCHARLWPSWTYKCFSGGHKRTSGKNLFKQKITGFCLKSV